MFYFIITYCASFFNIQSSLDQFKRQTHEHKNVLDIMCNNAFHQTLKSVESDGFIFTGDIHDMWIRDSAAQINQYIKHATHNITYFNLIKEVIHKQSKYIITDPYANSYKAHYVKHVSAWEKKLGRGGWVATRNYEVDSGAYFFRLVYKMWKTTGVLFNTQNTTHTIIDLWVTEQYHESSPYRYPELSRNGMGSPTNYTGMTWTGFRPSDDPCIYHYHIPDNIFVAVTLNYVKEMAVHWNDTKLYKKSNVLQHEIINGIHKYGIKDGRYCYEVDGLGNCNMMDDANIPSLLSLPYIDPENKVYDKDIYKKTKQWVLSEKNPYFFKGPFASGVGSPHTHHGYVWHLSMIIQAMVEHNGSVVENIIKTSNQKNNQYNLHESFDPNNPNQFTRSWFSWADSLFSEGWWCVSI